MGSIWVTLSLVIGCMQLLNIHGSFFRALSLEELDTTVIGEYRAFLNTNSKKLILVSNMSRNWNDAKKDCEKLGMPLLKRNKNPGIVNRDLWNDNQSENLWVNGTRMCGVNCSTVSRSNISCDVDCMTELNFLCQEKVWKLLRVHNGNLGFHFNITWSPLCFDLSFTEEEESKICEKTQVYELTNTPYLGNVLSATYLYGNNCKLTELSCPDKPPQNVSITTSCMNEECVEDENMSLTCSVVGGKPKPVIILETQGTDLNTTATWLHENNAQLKFSGSVSLNLSRDDDNKIFTCRVIYNDTFEQHNFTLKVLYRPIADVPEYVEVNETDEVIIQCNVSSNPQSNVTWTGPNGKELSTGTTLNISDIGRAAIGNYTCRAENKIGNISATARIYINAPPKMCLYLRGVTDKNQTVTMRCAATGIPTPKISWSKDFGHIITNSSKHSNTSMMSPANPYQVLSTLTAYDVGDSDVVGHTCSIENKNGKIKKTFRIRRKLKCRCLSRYLKNCVPLNYTQDELQQKMNKTREELIVKNLPQKLMKKICANDERASAKYIGALGVVVIAGALTFIMGLDLHGCFYNRNANVKRMKKKKNRSRKS